MEEPLAADNVQVGLEPGQPTIASLLKQVGYDTALIGKWHLGFRPEWGPNAHGFDEFFGILAGAGDYFLHKNGLGQSDLYENLTPVERRGSAPIRDRTFFWRIADQDAVRDGKWKFFRRGEVRRLFDLSFDEHEQADFSNKDPEVLRRLMGKFDRWNKEMRPRPQP